MTQQAAPDPLQVELITATVREPNARLMELYLKPGVLTAEEREYLDACEQETES